ncbi:hypothetical protein BS50DRAFT_595007 [Corynespora cassiicola Philippines]|uniref:Uncharacterized protein n=1 Tax=Corynespora cassiicola Philippines TaxID=1448308 RepID=A0A2T2N0M5_CORCC|nr:hypothetical protein BS50DRAFT_595007 [Corynespora cassiicola Philippines]
MYSHYSTQTPSAIHHEKMEHLENHINNDIELYIDTEVTRIAKLMHYSSRDQDQIRKKLLNERSRTYLPVVLLLRDIESNGYRSLEQVINCIPEDLGSLYTRLFHDISHGMQLRKQQILMYLAYSVGDMASRDIAHACHVLDSRQSTRVTLAKNLDQRYWSETKRELNFMTTIIRFQRDDVPVSFIHITAKQFLAKLSENREFSDILLRPSKAHTEIVTACLMLINKVVKFWIKLPTGYLSAHERDQRFLSLKEVPFLEYSLRHWYPHLKQTIDSTPETEKLEKNL